MSEGHEQHEGEEQKGMRALVAVVFLQLAVVLLAFWFKDLHTALHLYNLFPGREAFRLISLVVVLAPWLVIAVAQFAPLGCIAKIGITALEAVLFVASVFLLCLHTVALP